MKNLLVTGGCGFIGSNFINYVFKQEKYNIINVDALYYCANKENVLPEIRNSKHYTFIKGNLTNKDFLEHILETYQVQEVIHFAAQSHVENSFEDSLQYSQDNILGTHILLECCRKYNKIEKFIHVSTDDVKKLHELIHLFTRSIFIVFLRTYSICHIFPLFYPINQYLRRHLRITYSSLVRAFVHYSLVISTFVIIKEITLVIIIYLRTYEGKKQNNNENIPAAAYYLSICNNE